MAPTVGLVLIVAALLAAVLLPPILLALVVLVGFLLPVASTSLAPTPVLTVAHGSPGPPCDPRGPPRF